MEFFYWSENLVELSFENYIIFLGKFLRVWSASVHELRGDRLGDRPRNYSRIRRSGSTVRRRRWDWRKRDRYRKWDIKKERKRKGSVTRSPTIRDDSIPTKEKVKERATVYRKRERNKEKKTTRIGQGSWDHPQLWRSGTTVRQRRYKSEDIDKERGES